MERPFSPEALLTYSEEHLYYEIKMFGAMGEILQPFGSRITCSVGDPQNINNAIIESFGFHFRVLMDFFDQRTRDTDVRACDFCDHWQTTYTDWKKENPNLVQLLCNARKRVDKELAHLTISRQKGALESKAWVPSELLDAVASLLGLFLEISGPSVSPRVREVVSSIKNVRQKK